jgi:hypothetical protein
MGGPGHAVGKVFDTISANDRIKKLVAKTGLLLFIPCGRFD